jgi:hypothetical protein
MNESAPVSDNRHPQDNEHSRTYEPSGVDIGLLKWTLAGIVALVMAALAISWLLMPRAAEPRDEQSAAREFRAPDESAIYPPLNPAQQAQRRTYESRQQRLLSTYGWIDREQGIAHIPIERAMELTVQNRRAAP